LKSKLESTDNDETVFDIVLVFRAMSDMGTYDVAGDKALMSVLREKVRAIRDPSWRRTTEEHLQAILKTSSKS